MMSKIIDYLMDNWKLCAGVGGSAILIGLIKKYSASPVKVWPSDTVVLHQTPRGPWTPNHSPFPLKLETYLRMAGTSYVVDTDEMLSSKGKTPWISYNGEDVGDSELSIQYLNKKLDINLNKHLTNVQKATATAFQRLVDEHLYWCFLLWRWKYEPGLKDSKQCCKEMSSNFIMSLITRFIFTRRLVNGAWGQGMGRHTEMEVYDIANVDLRALSDYLGTKRFLVGEEPCEQDCAVFAMLSWVTWHYKDSPLGTLVVEKYPNLRDYCVRMKERFWPDWDQCITHGYSVKAEK